MHHTVQYMPDVYLTFLVGDKDDAADVCFVTEVMAVIMVTMVIVVRMEMMMVMIVVMAHHPTSRSLSYIYY